LTEEHKGYRTEPYPPMRRFAVDAGWRARRRHIIHGLLELDVTVAREHIRNHRAQTGERLSFTAFVINCLARAAKSNDHVHAVLNWRNQLVIFDDVNVNTMVEVKSGDIKVAMPYIIEAADKKTYRQIHDEIRSVQAQPAQTQELRFMRWFLVLPGFLRRTFYGLVTKNPNLLRRYTASVLVTAVGMFGSGAGWGIPAASFSLTVTLGGIAKKPGVVADQIAIREYLHVTLSFDHDIIDGAPAARFAEEFRTLIEIGYGLVDAAEMPDTAAP
jgi:pyruvate/2-oxoglutarate dehydrogenase complex dihydrolipoamide acyltransferase (E2) component